MGKRDELVEMSSGIVLNTPTVLLDKDFDPFEQMVPNYGDWEHGTSLPDQIFATIHDDDDDKDDNVDGHTSETVSYVRVRVDDREDAIYHGTSRLGLAR